MVKHRVLVHLSDGEVSVKLTGTRPEHAVRFPAAFAIIREEETVYFEKAIALKEFDKAEFYEFVGNFLNHCPQEQLDCFFQAIFLRKDVLNVVGSLNKDVVVCSTFIIDFGTEYKLFGSRCISNPTDSIMELFIYSEEELYSEGFAEISQRLILNLQPGTLNLYESGTTVLEQIGPGFDDILNFFVKLLCQKGYDFTDSPGQEFCRQLVLEYCYVALDLDKEQEKVESRNGVLFVAKTPDGDEIELGEECFLAPEVLFQPALIGIEGKGIAEETSTILQQLRGSTPGLILSGMLAKQLKGFSERLKNELDVLITEENSFAFYLSDNIDAGAMKIPQNLYL